MSQPSAKIAPTNVDRRVPPHSAEAEMAVLGAALLREEALDLVRDRLDKDDFYLTANRRIFAALCALSDRGDALDPLTLRDELKAHGWLDDAGGTAYIDRIMQEVHTSANVDSYADIVAENAKRRAIIDAAHRMMGAALETAGDDGKRTDADDVLASAQSALCDIAVSSKGTSPYSALESVVNDSLSYVENRMKSGGAMVGVPSSLPDLDELTGGFEAGELAILAARPGMGKTALALDIALKAAMYGKSVLFFSCEMRADQLGLRMLASTAGVNIGPLIKGVARDEDYKRVCNSVGSISELPIYIDDSFNITIQSIRAKAARLRAETGDIGIIVVDYLQMMGTDTHGKNDTRDREISRVSRGLKLISREFSCPVLALSQLNRQVEMRPDKRPRKSDLRDSGSLEQDATYIIFIYRDSEYWTPEEWDIKDNPWKCEINLAKNRTGPTGMVYATFMPEWTTFRPYTKAGVY